jgi:predicted Zn finger-like uncharacterized protein
MLTVCPSCATSYMLDPASVGPAGRMVRCARCKTAWFTGGPKPQQDVRGFVANVIAEAEGRETGAPMPGRRTAANPPPGTKPAAATLPPEDDFGAEPSVPVGMAGDVPPAHGADAEDPDFHVHAAHLVPLADAPSLVPPNEPAPMPAAGGAVPDPDDIESFAARRERMQVKRKQKRRSSKWTAIILVLFGFNVALIGARHEVVHYLPQTASLFAAVGLPVNLRQLTFENVKVSKEEHDGVAVLVVEGAIVSAAGKPVEVPRLRLAVRNTTGQEIYSWSAQPGKSILAPGESLPFRSRLASPPADSSDVLVRFFNSRDALPNTMGTK